MHRPWPLTARSRLERRETEYPQGARVSNPAFDVTPAELITAVVTENGVRTPKAAGPPRPSRSVP
nr:hypothetical protein [Amycolatopsis jejuensis]